MKTLNILSLIINILFYGLMIMGILAIGVSIIFLLGTDLGLKTNVTFSENNKFLLYFMLLSTFIYYAFYLYSIFLFKKNIDSFTNYKLFTDQVIKNFKVIGIIYIIGYLFSKFIASVIPFDNNFQVNFGIKSDKESLVALFDFPLNGLIIGLFFLTLSQVFKIAKNQKEENTILKQENELTI